MKRQFTPEQLKLLRKVNPWLTDGLFNEIIKDLSEELNEDYCYYTFKGEHPDASAFNKIKWVVEGIKVVNASDLYFETCNYPLIKETEFKYREFRRYYIFNDDNDNVDYNYYLNKLASLFKEAFTNVYRVYVDAENKKIAFAFWL